MQYTVFLLLQSTLALNAKKADLPLGDLSDLDLDKNHNLGENEHDLGSNKHEEENPPQVANEYECEDYLVNGHSGPYLCNEVPVNQLC